MLGGFRETEDVAVRILNVEVQCAPRSLGEMFGDRRPAANQLVVECADLGHVNDGIEVLPGSAMAPLGLELRGSLEVDRSPVSRDARVGIAVDEVGRETQTLFVECDCVAEVADEKLRRCSLDQRHGVNLSGSRRAGCASGASEEAKAMSEAAARAR